MSPTCRLTVRLFWLESTLTVVGVWAGTLVEVVLEDPVPGAVVVDVDRLAKGEVEVVEGADGPAVDEVDRDDVVVLDEVEVLEAFLPEPPPHAAAANATDNTAADRPNPCPYRRLAPELTGGRITDSVSRMDLQRLEQVELIGVDGATHRLGDLWAERPVILVFLRHFG